MSLLLFELSIRALTYPCPSRRPVNPFIDLLIQNYFPGFEVTSEIFEYYSGCSNGFASDDKIDG